MEAKYPGQIKVFYSATCDSIDQLPGGGGIEVRASLFGGGAGGKGEGDKKVFRPRLLVGADGVNSMVSGLEPRDEGTNGADGDLWMGVKIEGGRWLFRLSFC